MTMTEKLRIHREVETQDLQNRIWFRNSEILDRMTDEFPIGATVENFGVRAKIVGYETRDMIYTGDLILADTDGLRWVARTKYCKAVA